MANEREAKQMEAATEALSGRLAELKSSAGQLILKLETDQTLNWPSFLDSYALISGQMNSLLRTMKHEKTPALKKYITLPLLLSPDRDEELLKITEHRVQTFSHDLIPDYLRTRPDPDIESRHQSYEGRAGLIVTDQQTRQLNAMDKITKDTLKLIARDREEMDAKSAVKNEMEKTHSVEDTNTLLAAINHGKGLKAAGPPGGPGSLVSRNSPVPGPAPGSMGPGQQQVSKAPSTIKTNIKAASQVHPYQR